MLANYIMSKNKISLPNQVIPFQNPDKLFQQEATGDLLFMPHSSRIILYGGPSTGKTTCILNLCLHQNYDRIIVVHNDNQSKNMKILIVSILMRYLIQMMN